MKNKSDVSKLERLYVEYASKMKYAAFAILKDMSLAEDAVHDAFVKLARNTHKIYEPDRAKTSAYMLVSAKNAAINIYNKRYRHGYDENIDSNVNVASSFNVENYITYRETLQEIAKIIGTMNPVYGNAFMLYYVFGHTIHEISIMTNSKEDTVRKRIQRAKAKIEANIDRRMCYEKE